MVLRCSSPISFSVLPLSLLYIPNATDFPLKSPIELKNRRPSQWEVLLSFFIARISSSQNQWQYFAIYIDWAKRSLWVRTLGWWGLLFGSSMSYDEPIQRRREISHPSQQRELESTQELELSTRERSRDGTKPWGYWQSSLIGRNLTFSDRLLWSQRPQQVFIVLKELRSPPSPPPSFFLFPPSILLLSFFFLFDFICVSQAKEKQA